MNFINAINCESDLKIILESYKKGIFNVIKGDLLPKSSKLIKIYATSVFGARRIVFLVDVVSDVAFFLFFRTKNDKIGKNISIKNPYFKKYLHLYLSLLGNDIDSNNVEVFDL